MLRRVLAALLALPALLVFALPALAHESRPAYLEINQTAPARYDVLWRTPVLSGMRLPVVLVMPAGAQDVVAPAVHHLGDSTIERRVIDLPGGLAGKRIEFAGLPLTLTDVLVRVQLHDAQQTTTLVRPAQPWVEVAAREGPLAIAGAYLAHGVEHILLGYDHLLFVLALVLIVPSLRVLFWTITSFTLAHSITLALATLGVVHVPGAPVEAAIALSILLLACEIVRVRRGQSSLTQRWPWLVAFSFGLLHGFGFAGALSEIGLPPGDIPLALFAFNIGVEAGQLVFIGAVLGLRAAARHLRLPAMVTRRAEPAATFAIGTLAAFWLLERVFAFVA
ncbi:MAG TPA: HupE/UreJ family protein [Rubrivivax sp.]|nr:HupE/UreJ family protein [Rubrivivax sp.]